MDADASAPDGQAAAWRKIDTFARRDHGALRRSDAVAAGLHPRLLSYRAGEMQWGRPYRGVYTLPGTRKTLQRDSAAALLAVGSDALLTGEAALYLYGVLSRWPAAIDVLIPASARRAARVGIRLHRTRTYDAIRPRTIDGLRVVHPTRALADVATFKPPLELARHIARAVALRHCTLDQANRELDVRSRFPGRCGYLHALAMLRGELTHSDEEAVAREHLRKVGLQPFPRPFPIVVDGVLLAEADIAILDVCYDVEVDGPHHDLPEQARAEKARDRRLGRGGWTVDRFPVEFVTRNPTVFAREVLTRVRQLRARLA